MPKVTPLTREEVSKLIAYEPETGRFTWLVSPAKNVKTGTEAGCAKGVRISKKTGLPTRYVYIRMNNIDTPAARVAWLLHYGVWPNGNVLFVDNDPSNLRIKNLREAVFTTEVVTKGEKKTRKMSSEAQRHYGLRRYYGLTLQEYGEKLVAQNGVCAICAKAETAMLHGKVKPLSVDHAHSDGRIRDLLCAACNHLLGHAKENRDVLLAAVRYLDKHAGAENVVTLVRKDQA